MIPKLTRRTLFGAAGATLAVPATAGCDALSTTPTDNGSDRRQSGKGGGETGAKEAPMLAQRVQAGTLPSLTKRLPSTPMVVKPTDAPGAYGGTWHSWLQGPSATYVFMTQIGYENLVRWSPDCSEVMPNLAESWEIHQGGKEYVFHLREGMRWSDGKPFSADDLVFAYEDVLLNTDLYPAGPPGIFTVNDTPAKIEKVDDHAVRFTFPGPNGLFLQELARPGRDLYVPRHYMKQFHKKYANDVDALVQESGFETWADLFMTRNDLGSWQNSDRPVFDAWVVVKALGNESAGAEFERNPYYWKTDSDGRQLPYLDTVSYKPIEDLQTALLATTSGDIDLNAPTQAATVCTSVNKPVLARNREKGQYGFFDAMHAGVNQMVIMLNLTHQDPKIREVFQSRDFRIGLSYAINRPEVIDTVFQRQGKPWQAAPRKESPFFLEKLAKQYTEYDVARSNAHLDRAGYARRDSDGYRVRGDGERISFTVDNVTEAPNRADALGLIKKYWKAVGVQMEFRSIDRSLFFERTSGNQHDAIVWGGAGGWRDAILTPGVYFPSGGGSRFAIPWVTWYQSGGADGEEPPPAAKEQMDLYDRAAGIVDEKKRREMFMRVLEIAQEQFWIMGTALPVGAYGTVRNDFANGPEWIADTYTFSCEGPTRPEQYYRSSPG